MLDTAVNGLPLGAYDALILAWLRNQDLDVMATVASLLRRAWLAGVETGHAEALDETGTAPEVEGLRRALSRITSAAREANRQLDDETADRQEIAETLIDTIKTATRGVLAHRQMKSIRRLPAISSRKSPMGPPFSWESAGCPMRSAI